MFKVWILQANFNIPCQNRVKVVWVFFRTLTTSKIPCNREDIHFANREKFSTVRRNCSMFSYCYLYALLEVRSFEYRIRSILFLAWFLFKVFPISFKRTRQALTLTKTLNFKIEELMQSLKIQECQNRRNDTVSIYLGMAARILSLLTSGQGSLLYFWMY